MKVLITGAAGYIGGRMVESLRTKDWVKAVVGTDIKAPEKDFSSYKFYKRDIRDAMDDIVEKVDYSKKSIS